MNNKVFLFINNKILPKPIDNKVIEKLPDNKVLEKPIDNKVLVKPINNKVSKNFFLLNSNKVLAKPIDNKVLAKPIDNKVLVKPINNKVSKNFFLLNSNKVLAKPINNKLIAKPINYKESEKPINNNININFNKNLFFNSNNSSIFKNYKLSDNKLKEKFKENPIKISIKKSIKKPNKNINKNLFFSNYFKKVLNTELNLNFNERVNYYLGTLICTSQDKISLNDYININNLTSENSCIIYNSVKNLDINNKNYDEKLNKLLVKTKNINKKFGFIRGDMHNISSPSFCKVREIDNDGIILRCLNFGRHWNLYYNKPLDKPFFSKISHIFWRGTTTGFGNTNITNRFILIERWFNKHPHINIGFSSIKQGRMEYQKYLKEKVDPEKFLDYKYLLSVNGNDKDSGLNWKLNSNSLVLMTAPKICSWLMESTLIPDYHYVLLKDDFSDLEEKLHWCNNNQSNCIEIIRNANKFMKQFSNEIREQEIEVAVINEYFKKII